MFVGALELFQKHVAPSQDEELVFLEFVLAMEGHHCQIWKELSGPSP